MGKTLRFDGEVAIVAGGGGSLGGAYARMFGALGAKVIVNDISDSAQAVADAIVAAGGDAIAVVASSVDRADDIVAQTIDRYGRLDIVVNSSGLTGGGLFHKMAPEEWDRVFDSHFASTLALARAVWPHLVASGNGRLINTASTAIFGSEYTSTYVAAKAAIFAASRTWAMEGASQNVRVNVILPTAISQMTSQIPDKAFVALLERAFQPDRVAGLIGYLAHRDTTITGCAIECGGGRAAPVFLAEGDSFAVDRPESPDSWASHAAALTARVAKHTPYSMMEELEQRLKDMGPAIAGASDTTSNVRWSEAKHGASA
ncbi:SDR family oxidoreductase [Sphingomonas crocodyli]|uniref:SDR family oxidoreductase n=1 Tax=Sphingomonas crocodyli TaxID=1979270 RepID=A0A437LWD3_9SPHN|nr:SDR family oxidoreductase [Sphingomonas crocodyli]RVT89715.1 SDR family oxidoreductase [Sphingomonas crocodyli]